jgi:hypothetical protein
MIAPHPFTPTIFQGAPLLRCDLCARFAGDPLHVLALPGCETSDTDRETARQLQQAADLTAAMRRPLDNVSKKAGNMERNAPLFLGTGNNPILF